MASSATAAQPAQADRALAIVTGASSGIGLELAKLCAEAGYDLLLAADRPLTEAEAAVAPAGVQVQCVETDLATTEGVDSVMRAAGNRAIGVLCANAGQGQGGAFLDQDFGKIRHVIDTNVTGTLALLHRVGQHMRGRGEGRILVTGSIAGYQPGAFNAVYNGTKAFVDSFSVALREELKDSGVSVTLLMPGATETPFFDRAGMRDTKIGQSKKDDPADVAKTGFDAMMRGDADVVHGLKNKLMTAASDLMPASVTARQHAKMARPNDGQS